MKRYVAGFLFNSGCTHVALVEKQKPEWQKGLLNAIGGKIECVSGGCMANNTLCEYEAPVAAMAREFVEETGMETQQSDWALFCILTGDGFEVHFFYYVMGVHDIAKRLKTTTDEKILVEPIRHNRRRIANLEWLIPMAISAYMGENSAKVHLVTES